MKVFKDHDLFKAGTKFKIVIVCGDGHTSAIDATFQNLSEDRQNLVVMGVIPELSIDIPLPVISNAKSISDGSEYIEYMGIQVDGSDITEEI